MLVTEIRADAEVFYIDWDREAGDEFPTIHYEFQDTPGERVVKYFPHTKTFLWGDAEDYQEVGSECLGHMEDRI